MSFYNDLFRQVSGKSVFGGFVGGFSDYVRNGFDGFFSRSPNARLKSGLAVLSVAGLLFYVNNKGRVDGAVDSFGERFSLMVESSRLESRVQEFKSDLSSLESERLLLEKNIASLLSVKDSLNGLVESYVIPYTSVALSDDVSSNHDSFSEIVESVEPLQKVEVAKSSYNSSSKNIPRRVVEPLIFKNSYVSEGNIAWVRVPEDGSLSRISFDFYGSYSKFKDVASLNNLENPNFVLRNQPLRLDKSLLVSSKNVFFDEFPSYGQVLRSEYLENFSSRLNLSVSADSLLEYNNKFGNFISKNQLLIRDTDVVYFKSNWLKGD